MPTKRGSRRGSRPGTERPGVEGSREERARARSTQPTTRRGASRRWLFGALTVACVVVAVVYTSWAAMRDGPAGAGGVAGVGAAGAGWEQAASQPRVIFQNVVRDDGYAKVAAAPIDEPNGPREVSGLTCERVHFAGGRGLCLVPEFGLVTTFWAVTFGPDLEPIHRIELSGIPSRARVSPDGRYGAATVFVYGHSYAEGNFSTETIIIDMATGESLGDLEQFTVERDGETISNIDFNFWGVTFADDSNRFYATLRTEGSTYLVEGDIAGRSMRVLRENVECPSLSPDGSRVAFKKYVGEGSTIWRLHVLDLATLEETAVAEPRSIDDQVEWLDDERILYAAGADVWVAPADGSGEPELFISEGLSPAVVR